MTKKIKKIVLFYDDGTYEEVLTEQASIFNKINYPNGGIPPYVQPYPNGKIPDGYMQNKDF